MTLPPGHDQVWSDAREQLTAIIRQSRYRNLSTRATASSGSPVNFCSNDYLGLSRHPRVIEAAAEAAATFGAGAGASRLVTGNLEIHHQLEQELARFKGTEAVLVFSSGYLANLGVIEVLSHRADGSRVPILLDRLCHASLVDGARQAPSLRTFPHNNTEVLRERLGSVNSSAWPSALVLTEGVFSMDGDLAPLREMADLCAAHKAILMVDDAHGTGTVGPGGRGSAARAGISHLPHVVQTGTLSKSLGSQGGFVAGSSVLKDLLINRARPFIFETGLAPACAGAALAALQIIQDDPGLVDKLSANIAAGTRALGIEVVPESPIIPLVLGDENLAMEISRQLRERGIEAKAIRPPTVPAGTSRLRITISAEHTAEDFEKLKQSLVAIRTPLTTS